MNGLQRRAVAGCMTAALLVAAGCTTTPLVGPPPQDQQSTVERNLHLRYYDSLTEVVPPDNRLELELLEQPGEAPLTQAYVLAMGDTLRSDSTGLYVDSSGYEYFPGDDIELDVSWEEGDTLHFRSSMPLLSLEGLEIRYDLHPGLDTLTLSWTAEAPVQYLWVAVAAQKTLSIEHSEYVQGSAGVWSFPVPEDWWGTFRLRWEFSLDVEDEQGMFDDVHATYTYDRRLDVYP